jgi:hypothetical protein
MIVQFRSNLQTTSRLAGLAIAREANRLLAWDAGHRLYLWDLDGKLRHDHTVPVPIAAAGICDDGNRIVAASKNGQLWWFDGSLQLLFDHAVDFEPVAVALESFGNHLVVSNRDRHTHLFNANGQLEARVETPKALNFLTFIPSQTRFVGAADFGLIACFDARGESVWQHVIVSHIGSICVDGMGQAVWVACFTDGLRRFDPFGKERDVVRTQGSCRLSCCDFDGTMLLTGQEPSSLSLLKPDGKVLSSYTLSRHAAFLVMDALGERGAFASPDGQVTLFALQN